MIRQVVINPTIRPNLIQGRGYLVQHPSNGAILAYCDTQEEALAYVQALNDIPGILRDKGFDAQ